MGRIAARWVLPVALWVACSSGSAEYCVGPTLGVEGVPSRDAVGLVDAGSRVSVVGRFWASSCTDANGSCGEGGFSDPVEDIRVGIVAADGPKNPEEWVPAGSVTPLATVDAGADFSFRLGGAQMPARTGRYLLVAATPHWDMRPYGWIVVR